MFRLVTLNLNGIRSAANKGFVAWAEGVGADCMGVQEVKAQAETCTGRFDTVAGMDGHFHYAEKKGYSGVGGVQPRSAPSEVVTGFGDAEFDAEGRYVEMRFDTPADAAAESSASSAATSRAARRARSGRPRSSASSTLMYPHLWR